MDSDNKYLFIVIEGLDGTGKSTIAQHLSKELRGFNYKTPPAPFNLFRNIIDKSQNTVTRFLYYLDSVLYASFEIEKLLEKNHVICDRYYISTLAYHYAIDPELRHYRFERVLDRVIKPDFTFFLKANYHTRIQRMCQRENCDSQMILSDQLNHYELTQKIENEFNKFTEMITFDTQTLSPQNIIANILSLFRL